jgi:hypothetical protein
MLMVPLDGLGIDASGENGIGGHATALNNPRVCADTGAVTTPRPLRLAPVAVVLLVAVACTPIGGGVPPRGPQPTGDQNGPLNGCPVFPADNAWNTDISTVPLRSNSSAIVSQVLADQPGAGFLHADFGGGGAYGIPYVTVPASLGRVPVNFTEFPAESDPGPYAAPLGAPIEGGSDAHVIAIDRDNCQLFEMYHSSPANGSWNAGSGATWNLRSDALRPAGWTSADAAGLPIFPGLARFDEVSSGAIHHALRFTVDQTQRGYVAPARHFASSSSNPNRPAMGMRFRLRASFDLTPYHGEALIVLQALKTYGMIVADNGTNWYVTGAADSRWDDNDLNQLKNVPGAAFDVVDTGPVTTG